MRNWKMRTYLSKYMTFSLVTVVTVVTVCEMVSIKHLNLAERGEFVTNRFVTACDKFELSQTVTRKNDNLVTAKDELNIINKQVVRLSQLSQLSRGKK